MARQVRLARGMRTLIIVIELATIAGTAIVAGCAHAPHVQDPRAWLATAPPAAAVVASAQTICRKRLEVGTRIPVTRCLTREEELRERRRGTTLLGLVGGGQFRDGG